jgi:hypothetical protein
MTRRIGIITDWDGHYGSGHIQRMAALCRSLNDVRGVEAAIINAKAPGMLRDSGQVVVRPALWSHTDCIVRDMRDSSVAEMTALRERAPVLAIDDSGPGRALADSVLDLLPNAVQGLESGRYRPECYLYGHNFLHELARPPEGIREKDVDVALYAGHEPAPGDVAFFSSLVPKGRTGVICAGTGAVAVNGDAWRYDNSDYASLLLRARVFVSHFGISIFEARLCGCQVLTVNPTAYHASLARMVLGSVVAMDAGVRGDHDAAHIARQCEDLLRAGRFQAVNAARVLDHARACLAQCREAVLSLANEAAR